MSDVLDYVENDYDVDSAVSYNEQAAQYLGWYEQLPENSMRLMKGLDKDPVYGTRQDKEQFSRGVFTFQRGEQFLDTSCDGKLGPMTWESLLARHEPVLNWEQYYVNATRRIALPKAETRKSNVLAFDKSGGLDLHPSGHFSRSKKFKKPRFIVVHWGGVDPQHLHRVFSGHRKVSSHFGCGRSDDGDPEIYQYLDLAHRAWHAGWINKHSIGVDISQQPTTKFAKPYAKKKYDIQIVENLARRPDGRTIGNDKILSLDPAIATATRELVLDLCGIMDIPPRAPRGDDGFGTGSVWHGVFGKNSLLSSDFRGVVGHHHLSNRKWDVACWWDAVFAGTPLA